jgi:hypothetical protein
VVIVLAGEVLLLASDVTAGLTMSCLGVMHLVRGSRDVV